MSNYAAVEVKGEDQEKRERLDEPLRRCTCNLGALLTVMSVCNQAQIEPITSGNVEAWRKIAASFERLDNKGESMTIQSILNGYGFHIIFFPAFIQYFCGVCRFFQKI